VTPGPYGHSLGSKDRGDIALVRGVNDELQRTVPQGAYFVHLEQVSGIMGRDRFYDPRRYAWTKQPFSEDGTVLLARHIWSGIRAMISGPKKVLVLDLDNTIWGGVVGETGPLGVELGEGPDGEAYRAFQTYVKKLTQRGVLLTVCSKNNDADAREPFEKNPSMVLALDDFAHFEASWDPKAAAIRRTADVLQLGLDSFVFFDDNPAEREHIRQLIDEVEVVEVPLDPSEYIRALEDGLWFEAVSLTGEDRVRVDQYHTERLRREAGVQFESIDAYLGSLNMTAEVRGVDDGEMDRVIQLIGKTNQFNLTTRRHSVSAVREMIDDPHAIALTLRVADRFGDYGLVSVLLATRDNGASVDALTIDTWLMSCRVINRTVEEFFFNYLVGEARRRGVRRLVGHFVPSSKNALVKDLYDRLGFVRRPARTGSCVVYDLDLDAAPLAKTMVCIAGAVSSDGAA
jgi:FkbH-like protein